MARPNSKYFTPVIKKLLEMKKSEVIEIDQEFKAMLRMNLIGGVSPVGNISMKKSVRDDVPEKTGRVDHVSGFVEWFGKWRYRLALVPAALVLLMVCVYAFRLPVAVKNETIVPVVQNDGQLANVVNDKENNELKLMSAESVLGSDYLKRREVVIDDAPSKENETPVVAKTAVDKVDNLQIVASPSSVQSSVEPNKQYSTEEVLALPAASTANNSEVINTPPPVAGVSAVIDQNVMVSTQETQAPFLQEDNSSQQIAGESVPVKIVYTFAVSESQKAEFEQHVISRVIGSRVVSSIVVCLRDGDVWSTEVHYRDGKVQTFNYKKDLAKNVWNRVSFVKKGYYDDSLVYEVLGR